MSKGSTLPFNLLAMKTKKGNDMAIDSIVEDLKVSRDKAVGELNAMNQHQSVLRSVVDRLDSLIEEAAKPNSLVASAVRVTARRGRKPGVKSTKASGLATTVKRTRKNDGPTLTQAAVDVVLAGEGDVTTRQVIDQLVSENRLDGGDRSVAYAKVHTALKRPPKPQNPTDLITISEFHNKL